MERNKQAELVYSSSTGSMLNHIKSKHPGCTGSADAQKCQKTVDSFSVRHCPPGKSEQITNTLADMITIWIKFETLSTE
jgi:hypothetical protein